MSEASLYRDSMLAGLLRLERAPQDWLNALRSRALEAAHALVLPGRADEDWRFTDLSSLYRLAFTTQPAPALPSAGALEALLVPEACARLVFVDGVFAPALSLTREEDGLRVTPLRRALELSAPCVRATLGTLSAIEGNAFVAINTAYLQDGAVIQADRNSTHDRPVQLLFLSTQAGAAFHPRVLVVAGEASQMSFIEDHAALHDGLYCANAVTEVAVGAGAQVRHIRVQRESTRAYHLASCAVEVARDGAFLSHAVSSGALLSRYDLAVRQRGEGVRMTANGLAVLDGRQVADTHSSFEHGAGHGSSRQKHKTILAGTSHAVFNGRILVQRRAQGTDSAQQSRNLLLSDRARVDTKPQLEIFADDVKCSHGATVGQLEAEELFYLRSRGMTLREARGLLTEAFAGEIIDGIPVPSLVRALRRSVGARMPLKEST